MHLTKFFAFFVLLIFPLHSENDVTQIDHKTSKIFSKETKKNKIKLKKKSKEDTSQVPPKQQLTISETFQKIFDLSFEKCTMAQEIEKSIIRTYANEKEVVDSLNKIADLYRSASQIVKENFKITQFFEKKEVLDQQIYFLSIQFDGKASSYTHQAQNWPKEVQKKRNDVNTELNFLKETGKNLEDQNAYQDSQEIYKQIATILTTLVENGEPDHGEIEEHQKKVMELAAKCDLLHLKDEPELVSQKNYFKDELCFKKKFYNPDKIKSSISTNFFPLDGQDEHLYLGQFYRYLIQNNQTPRNLKIKVFENKEEIHEELIEIPNDDYLWENHLVINDLLIPKSDLDLQYGLQLRLKVVQDPNVCFSLIISQKGTNSQYHYSFYLDHEHLYDLHFSPQLPWQLETILKPETQTTNIHKLSDNEIDSSFVKDCDSAINPIEILEQPYVNDFVKEMNGDPLALAQYVQNEIELIDPFLIRDTQGVFQAPSIQRNPDRTFLDKKGSPWEQCTLLAYLFKRAGYKTKYIEGLFALPKAFAEQLLFMQFPDENEISLNYPGVMFFDGQKWNALFPWMKEINSQEGHDLYSLLPEEYASAERWLKQYLCNDKNILKHIGTDGDDTVTLLFVRHLEEHLRNRGLSLQDIGTHRHIKKRQFNSWSDFPHPQIKSEIRASEHLPNRTDIFAKIRVTIQSEQNPSKKLVINNLNLSAFSLSSFALYFTSNEKNGHVFHFCSSHDWNVEHRLILDNSDTSLTIEVLYETLFGLKDGYNIRKNFTLTKGSVASLCLNLGSSSNKTTSIYADKFVKKQPDQEKLNALLSLIGALYFEKCCRSEQILAKLHKISPKVYFGVGLSKLSQGQSSSGELKFPQVDMCQFSITQNHNKHPFSKYQEPHSSQISYSVLANADNSSNEHQVLREIYQDPNAISTVKLLQIAHQIHQKKGLPGPGFLIFTNKSFADTNANPEKARLTHFSSFSNVDLRQLKTTAATQWKMLSKFFEEDQKHSYAYFTPGLISSLDGYSLKPPSYTGFGTLFHSNLNYGALISDGSNVINGGYGSMLSSNFVQTITQKDLDLVSNGTNYCLFPSNYSPLFNGTNSYHPSYNSINKAMPVFAVQNESHHLFTWKNLIWTAPIDDNLRADVRPGHKTLFSVVSDPVDVITGAFYVDEIDLNLPGPFHLELRRNYSSQNSLPGLFGFGWKLSLNPYLQEDGDKLFVAEQDGTVIIYRYDPDQNLWIVNPEDNPELNNFNSKGIGGIANPYHNYIEKKDSYILHGADGSKRIFENNLLKSWSDHAGNTLSFYYENVLLKRIENSNSGFITFDYNYAGKICEVYAKDGRRISYTYDSQGNLSCVTLPNGANIKYEYDRFHRIIRETKPHGQVLENIYQNNKVSLQRTPVGPYQRMVTSATFVYENGTTKVTDPNGNVTEYKIYNHQIYKITDPEGNLTFQSWFLDNDCYFDAESETIEKWNLPGAYPKSLKSSKDKRGLVTSYLYDEKGNVSEIFLEGDDLNGSGETKISKYFSYNSDHLCIEENTLNTKTVTSYDFHNPYLPKKIEKYSDDHLISFVEMDYTSSGLVKQKNHSGAITLMEYDNRSFPTKIIQKTGTEDPDVVTSFIYNDQGLCVDAITEDSIMHNEYDIMGNQCCCTILSNSGKVLSKTYAGFDQNNRIIWKQGIDPNDKVFFDYNASGLIKATRKSLSEIKDLIVTPSGTAYTLYEYDPCGHLIEQTDPLGNSTHFKNDALGRVFQSSNNGLDTTFTYESGGLLASTTSPNGTTTTNLYTTNGLLKTKINPDGSQVSFIYDHFGRIIQEEKNGIKVVVSYNDATLEEKRIDGEFTEIRKLDSHGNLIAFTDKAGFTTKKTYDALNRIKTECSPNGDITEWNYRGDTVICLTPNKESTIQRYEANQLVERQTFSADGSLVSQIYMNRDPEKSLSQEINGEIIKTTWTNTLGLPLCVQQEDQFTIKTYDACGNCIASIEEEGNQTEYEFDQSNRMTKKILPDGAVIHYEYDKNSNLIAYHMPGNLTWRATYDINDHKTAEWQEFKDKPFERWEYNYQDNRLIYLKDPQNRTHDYQYDSHGRLKKEIIDNSTREYTYDARGMISSVIETGNDISIVERSYDEIGRLVHEEIYLNGSLFQSTNQAWTSTSRSLQIGDHQRHLDYKGGRLKSVSVGNINLSYDYSIHGTLLQKKTPFSTIDVNYTSFLLPHNVDIQIGDKIYHESLSWTDSKKLKIHESTYPNSQNETFNYSVRGNLISTKDESYAFDFEKTGIGTRTSSPSLKALKDGLDEFGRINKELLDSKIVTTAYNSLGQVILHNRNLITWDSWGRIIGIKSDKYHWTASYDAFGRRLQTTYTPLKNYYLYKSKGKPVTTKSFFDPEHEFLEIGVEREGKTLWKLYGPNACDVIIDSRDQPVVLHHDMRNNLKAIISHGDILWSEDYPTPYGPRAPPEREEFDIESYAKSLNWQSKQMDPTGLIWLGARYYDPVQGRFLSPDPICHPSCLDLYTYANGDPINNVDLDGRFSSVVYKTNQYQSIDNFSYSIPVVALNETFEETHAPKNRSRKYDLSDLGRPELSDGLAVGLINGIQNKFRYARKTAIYISDLIGGYNIHAVYSSTMGFINDIQACHMGLNNEDTGRIRHIHEVWNAHFDQYPNGYFLQFCHSRGAIDVCNALLCYPEERRQRIIAVAIAPGGYIYSETCAQVTHYRVEAKHDLIPYGDSAGEKRESFTTKTLKSEKGAPFHDHTILSPTYRNCIQYEFEQFMKNRGSRK